MNDVPALYENPFFTLSGKPQSSAAQEVARKAEAPPLTCAGRKRLGGKLSASVRIQSGAKGKLVIGYNSLDELEGILKHIKK